MPPTAAEVLARVKSVGASLNVKVTVAVLAARLTSLLLTSTEAVGVTVSTAKRALVAPVPGLPLASCQALSRRSPSRWRCRCRRQLAVEGGGVGEAGVQHHHAGCSACRRTAGRVGEGEIGRSPSLKLKVTVAVLALAARLTSLLLTSDRGAVGVTVSTGAEEARWLRRFAGIAVGLVPGYWLSTLTEPLEMSSARGRR